ncbi:hypothetical protein pb186bvf_003063 [Paramecium bursaria]
MKHISIQFNLNINNHTNSFSIVGVLIVDFSLQLLLVNQLSLIMSVYQHSFNQRANYCEGDHNHFIHGFQASQPQSEINLDDEKKYEDRLHDLQEQNNQQQQQINDLNNYLFQAKKSLEEANKMNMLLKGQLNHDDQALNLLNQLEEKNEQIKSQQVTILKLEDIIEELRNQLSQIKILEPIQQDDFSQQFQPETHNIGTDIPYQVAYKSIQTENQEQQNTSSSMNQLPLLQPVKFVTNPSFRSSSMVQDLQGTKYMQYNLKIPSNWQDKKITIQPIYYK